MNRLLTDPIVRLIFQITLILVLVGLAAIAALSCLVLGARMVGLDNGGWDTALALTVRFLSIPLSDTFGQAVALIVATIPGVFMAVCFVPDLSGPTPRAGSTLNGAGHAALIALLLGGFSWFALLGIFQLNFGLIAEIVGDPTETLLAKGTTAGVLAFFGNYLAIILGKKAGDA